VSRRGIQLALAVLLLQACATPPAGQGPTATSATQTNSGGAATTGAPAPDDPTPPPDDPTPPPDDPTPPPDDPTPPPDDPPVGPPLLTVRSIPAGAEVETGIQCVNLVVTSGTGRIVGSTPVEHTPLSDADVAECPAGVFGLYTEIRLQGYQPHTSTIGLSDQGLEAGREYLIEVSLVQ
jgi:hypothetical protein